MDPFLRTSRVYEFLFFYQLRHYRNLTPRGGVVPLSSNAEAPKMAGF